MNADEIRYVMFKQALSMTGIETAYGTIPLDFDNDRELWDGVHDALISVLSKRLQQDDHVKQAVE